MGQNAVYSKRTPKMRRNLQYGRPMLVCPSIRRAEIDVVQAVSDVGRMPKKRVNPQYGRPTSAGPTRGHGIPQASDDP